MPTHLKDIILLDCGSTVSTFMNPNLITDICVTEHPMGMKTNAGEITLMLKGMVKNYGSV